MGVAVPTPSYDAVVIGLGETGLACARHLAGRGAHVAVVDSRPRPPGLERLRSVAPGVEVHAGALDTGVMAAARELVISPGVDPRLPEIREATRAGARLIGEITLFRRATAAPVLAITGSNGKSTVTSLVGALLRAGGVRAAVGGNLGTPALELLEGEPADVFVLELSSFQLETVEHLDAVSGAVLNISADHLDRYPDMDAYAAAKARILRGAGTAVVNADDPRTLAMAGDAREVVRFGLGPPEAEGDFGLVEICGAEWLARGREPVLSAAEVPLAGRHNLANVLAALAVVAPYGLPAETLRDAVSYFRGLPHRGEVVAVSGGVRWINDSKGTNVGAAAAAVRGCTGRAVLIAGGQGKGQDFAPLAEAAAGRVRAAVVIGEDAALIARALHGVCPVHHAPDLTAAVRRAGALAHAGDSVLLSPACASFDMFRDYVARGEAFRAAVREVCDG